MPALLRRRRRAVPLDRAVDQEEAQEPAAYPSKKVHDLFVLVPTEGGLSFRLFTFADAESAHEYLLNDASSSGHQRIIVFRARHSEPMPGSAVESEERPEAVAMIRDPDWPGVVHLHSFIDMESAQRFVREEAGNGLDLGLVLVYWAAPVSLDSVERPAGTCAAEPPAAPVVLATQPALPSPNKLKRAPVPAPGDRHRAVEDGQAGVAAVAAGKLPARGATPQRSGGTSIGGRSTGGVRSWPGWGGLASRVVQAMFLNDSVYEDVKRDPHATGQAWLIVSLGALAAGIGAVGVGPAAAIVKIHMEFLGWAAYAGAAYLVGTVGFGGRRSPGTLRLLLQTLGLAGAPAIFLFLGIIPIYGPLFILAVQVWLVPTTALAARWALGVDRESAGITAVVSCLVLVAVSLVMPTLIA